MELDELVEMIEVEQLLKIDTFYCGSKRMVIYRSKATHIDERNAHTERAAKILGKTNFYNGWKRQKRNWLAGQIKNKKRYLNPVDKVTLALMGY